MTDHPKQPIIFFGSLGLGFLVIVGARKALGFGHNIEVAILLGMAAAVGGDMARGAVLNRVSIILGKEIHATAAPVGVTIQVLGQRMNRMLTLTPWFGVLICFVIRTLALYHSRGLLVTRRSDVA